MPGYSGPIIHGRLRLDRKHPCQLPEQDRHDRHGVEPSRPRTLQHRNRSRVTPLPIAEFEYRFDKSDAPTELAPLPQPLRWGGPGKRQNSWHYTNPLTILRSLGTQHPHKKTIDASRGGCRPTIRTTGYAISRPTWNGRLRCRRAGRSQHSVT